MMNHEDALNIIISETCACTEPDSEGFKEFELDLHCQKAIITAKLKSKNSDKFEYEIKNVRIE